MRKFLLLNLLFFNNLVAEFKFLEDENSHFKYYKMLMIEGSLHRLEIISDCVDLESKEAILREVEVIRFNLDLWEYGS